MNDNEILKELNKLNNNEINKSLSHVADLLHVNKSFLSRLIKKYYNLEWLEYQNYRNDQEVGINTLIDEYANKKINHDILEKTTKSDKIYLFGNYGCVLLKFFENELLFMNKQVITICKEKELVNFKNDGLVFVIKEPNKKHIKYVPPEYIYVGYKLNNKLEYKSTLKLIIPCYKINQPDHYRYMYYLKRLFNSN